MRVEIECGLRHAQDVEQFVRSWSAQDRQRRFRSVSPTAADWLLSAMRAPTHGAVVAREPATRAVIGLLDFEADGDGVEFGVLVAASARRQGVARALFQTLLHVWTPSLVIGECTLDNAPAIAFLRGQHFQVERTVGNETRWLRRAHRDTLRK